MYEIEKGVEIPAPRSGSLRNYKFGEMEIGDSFLAPLAERQYVAMAVSAYKRRNRGWGYKTCRVDDETFRVWRTA